MALTDGKPDPEPWRIRKLDRAPFTRSEWRFAKIKNIDIILGILTRDEVRARLIKNR